MLPVKSSLAVFSFLVCFGAVVSLTNLKFHDLLNEYVTDFSIEPSTRSCEDLTDQELPNSDDALCDDVIDIPGKPEDELDEDYVLQRLGFIPYHSDDECDIPDIKDDDIGGETLAHSDKYCHYLQYQGSELSEDVGANQADPGSIHFHFHFHHRDYHHYHYDHHCHNRDYIKCQCSGSKCWCCLQHTFRFNRCGHYSSFKLDSCVTVAYKGDVPCTTTSAKPRPTTATTSPKPRPTSTTTTPRPSPTTTTTPRPSPTTTTTPRPSPTTTTTPRPSPTTTPTTTTTTVTPPPNMGTTCVGCCERHQYDVTFTVNSRSVFENSVTLDHLKPLCYNINVGGGVATVCVNFYNVDVRRGRVCLNLSGTWKVWGRSTNLQLHVGCMTLPTSRGLLDILMAKMLTDEFN